MLWLYFSIIAYFLFAFSAIADRYLLAGPLPHPRLYAFYVGILGILAIFLMPLGFNVPPLPIIGLAFAAGAVGILALFLFYRTVLYGKVSTAVPAVGALSPIFTLTFSFILFGEVFDITRVGILALGILVLGTILLSIQFKERGPGLSFRNIVNIIYTAAAFGLGLVLTKQVFIYEPFINGFIWMAWGGFLFSMLFLFTPDVRREVFARRRIMKPNIGVPFLAGKVIGTAGSLFYNYAIFLATYSQVVFISAISGVQYIFLLLFVVLFTVKNPSILKEELNKKSFALRLGGIAFILLGIYLLL